MDRRQIVGLTKNFGLIVGALSFLAIFETITLAQGTSANRPGNQTFSFTQEKQGLQIICRDGYLEFMMNPCTSDRLDRQAERDKAARLYGSAVGEIASRLDLTKEQSLELIRSVTNVNMAKRFAAGEFKDTDCPPPDDDPPISAAEEMKARQITCQLLEALGSDPLETRIASLSSKAEDEFSQTTCISPPRAHRILIHVRNEMMAGEVPESDCPGYSKK